MRMYLMTDLEGVAGVYEWDEGDAGQLGFHERRCRERRWLAQEVSAAADGFHAGGAQEVLVCDGHGGPYAIDLDQLDPRALVFQGPGRPLWLPLLDGTATATGIVGAHAKAGTEHGCLYHSGNHTTIRDWQFNGLSVGEMGVQAAIAGHFGIPFVFCAGDVWACREMEQLIPGIVTVAVKYGTGRNSALSCTPREAQRRIREGAEACVAVADRIEPFRLASPLHFRDERLGPSFDEEHPPEGWTVINAHVREREFADMMDFLRVTRDGFDPGGQALSYTPSGWE